jgi:hypothetical protein
MSFQITEGFVQQYAANIYMLSQQKGSRLRAYTRQETIQGKSKAFDRIGVKNARRKTARHENTPQVDTPQSKRWCYLNDYDDGDLIDQMDKIRLLNDPTSEYMLATAWALGRSIDDEVISAADGTVVTGVNQDGTATLADAQRVIAIDGNGNAANMNVETLRHIKLVFDAAEVPEEIPRHLAVTSSQLYALLGQTEVTNQNYAAVKALVQGEIDTFMGFKFHRLERLLTQTTSKLGSYTLGSFASGTDDVNGFRKCFAWAQDGLITGVGMDITARIGERADKCFSVQTYGMMSVGAVRMEEVKVVYAYCKET